ncbi:MAG: PQQ-binding-like beta-propeller repeat protein [Planctomycetaceae bacterium]|jgi:outer membrane protein assembly factor BamB|nr:PQQ-binding-like beta-propeller repeat protein [Planctomycetaceae bacterium]
MFFNEAQPGTQRHTSKADTSVGAVFIVFCPKDKEKCRIRQEGFFALLGVHRDAIVRLRLCKGKSAIIPLMCYRGLFLLLSAGCFLTFGMAQETENGTEQTPPLYESVVFPDRSFSRRIEQVDRLFETGRTLEAAQLLGGILESANYSFAIPESTEEEPARTLSQTVNDDIIDRIRKLPKEGRESYAFQFVPIAKRLLENAVAAGSLDEIQQVARKYFPTSSGASAAFLVGVTQFERGDYAAAFLTLDKLKRLHPSIPDALNPLLPQLLEESQNKLKNGAEQPAQKMSESAWLEQIGWRIPPGSPSQNSDTKATPPLLEQNWTVPLLNRSSWIRDIDSISQSIKNNNDVYIPASQPLVVGDQLITRTPGETIAVDTHSGKRLWIAAEPEYRLPAGSGLQPRPPLHINHSRATLRLFFWHDRIASQLSSDGERLFEINEHDLQGSYRTGFAFAVAVARNREGSVEDLRHYQGNTLAARDLKTGRILWRIGKFPYVQKHFDAYTDRANTDESLFTDDEKKFRETWFLGAPLPLQGRLYVIGESDGVLQLFVLEPQTGRLIARQAFAQTPTSYAASGVRQTYPLFPSASGGMVICPTGSGLIVALDAATLAPAWCFSYAPVRKPTPADRNPNMRPMQPWALQGIGGNELITKQIFAESGWQVPCMIIDGQRILAAPPDHPALYCLDLLTGKLLWEQSVSRANTLYVAGIHKDKVFLVTPINLLVLDMSNGQKISLPDTAFPAELKPAGVGVRSGDQYFIPFTDGQLAVADLNTGQLTWLAPSREGIAPPETRQTASASPIFLERIDGFPGQRDDSSSLFTPGLVADNIFHKPISFGNLVGIKGGFFSQSPTQIARFDQKEPLKQRAATLLQAHADDPEGLLNQGRILRSEGKLAEAIDAFRASWKGNPTVEAADFLKKSLLEAMRKDYPAWSHAVQELESLAEFPDEWGAILFAQFEGILQSGRVDDLASVLEKVFSLGLDQSVLVPVSGDHSAQLHWAMVCLMEENMAKGNHALKTKWEELAETFYQSLSRDSAPSHGDGVPLPFVQWNRPSVYVPPEIQRWSMFACIFRNTAAAEKSKQILQQKYEQYRLPLALDLREKPSLVSWEKLSEPFAWKSGTMEVQVDPALSAKNPPNLSPTALGESDRKEIDRQVNYLVTVAKNSVALRPSEQIRPIPFLGASSVEHSSFNYFIKMGTRAGESFFCCCDLSGQELWRLTLPTTINWGFQDIQRFAYSRESSVYIKGFQNFLLLVHGKSMTAIDTTPQSEKILWSKTLSSVPLSQQNNVRTNNPIQRPDFHTSFPKNSTFVSPHAVCCWDTNGICGLDPLSGQILWVRQSSCTQCTILGDDENLFLVFPEIQQVAAIDPANGREIVTAPLPPGGVYSYGTNIVFIEENGYDYALSICDLRNIHDKHRRALLLTDFAEGKATPPIPKETLHDGVRKSSIVQTLQGDRLLSIATWDKKSLQIYDLQTKKALLPPDNKLLDFVDEKGLVQSRMRCDVELVGDRILVLFTKNTQILQNTSNPFEKNGRMVTRRYVQVHGGLGLPIDEGVMMLFDSEGKPDPNWIGPGAMYDSEGNRLSEPDPDWKPGRPTIIKKIFRLLDVPDRLPVMLFAVGVAEKDIETARDDSFTRIMVVDKRTGGFSFRKELRADVFPALQTFGVNVDLDAQEMTLRAINYPSRMVKLRFAEETMPEE